MFDNTVKEKIISQAIYDAISQNDEKTVTVIHNGDYAYFDYEKGVQLTPVVLKTAVPLALIMKDLQNVLLKINLDIYLEMLNQ